MNEHIDPHNEPTQRNAEEPTQRIDYAPEPGADAQAQVDPSLQPPSHSGTQQYDAPEPQSVDQERPSGPRAGTVVWGLAVLAIGLGVLAAAAGAKIDFGLAAIFLLGGAGVALVAGSVVSSLRRRGKS